ncbi:MAG: hypothetical protein OEW15_18425 [Nitrospirota bacterium]|nr:hypothetical protein [Nitrospirota bacterium]
MKKMFAVVAVLVVAAMMFAGCGSDSSSPGATAVTTTTQGAQTAKVGASTASNVVNSAFSINGMVSSSMPGAAKFSNQTKSSKAFSKRMARTMPLMRKAKAAIIKKATYTYDCTDGGSFSITDNQTSFTMTETNCKEGGELRNGTFTLSCGDASCNSITMSGSSSGTYYVQDWNTVGNEYTTVESKWADSGSLTFSMTLTNTVESYTMNESMSGWFENYVDSPTWKEEYADSGLSITLTGSLATQTVYDLSISMNGTMSWKYSESGKVIHGETLTYSNLKVADTWDDQTGIDEFTIDGTVIIDLTPDDTCAEGSYTFKTVTPITYNWNTGLYTAGEITINTVVVVKYGADGTVSVSIDSGKTFTDYTDANFDAMCANL